MRLSARQLILLRVATGAVLAFIYVPLIDHRHRGVQRGADAQVAATGLHHGVVRAGVREHRGAGRLPLLAARPAAIATSIALVLGTLAALGVSRYRFFGRETVSFLVILPIALPGHRHRDRAQLDIHEGPRGSTSSLLTLVIAHATFCIVVVYNNVIARLRRLSTSFEEASADLGATPWQTFRWVTLPNMRTALVAGALLAFALSFDEIIVTVFTIGVGEETLPQWLLNNFSRANQLPIVNAVAVIVILLSIIPVYLAHKLSSEVGEGAARRPPRPRRPSRRPTASAQDLRVLGVPAELDLHARLPAIVGAGPVGGLLERDQPRAVAERDGDLGHHAEVDAGLDRPLDRDHAVLDLSSTAIFSGRTESGTRSPGRQSAGSAAAIERPVADADTAAVLHGRPRAGSRCR